MTGPRGPNELALTARIIPIVLITLPIVPIATYYSLKSGSSLLLTRIPVRIVPTKAYDKNENLKASNFKFTTMYLVRAPLVANKIGVRVARRTGNQESTRSGD